MSFININNKQENVKATYSAFVIREALLSIETKDAAKADAIVESIEGELTLNEALEFFSAKLKAMNALNVALLNEAAQEEWVGYIEYPKGKKLEKTFKTSRAANTWSRKNMDDILSQKDVESIGTMSKKEWDKHEAKYALTESLNINEGTMSEIHMLAKEAKNIAEFTKKFFKEFGDKIKKTTETIEWVESLYTDVVAESLVTERSINKIQKEFSEVVNDMTTTVANWKTAEGDTKIQLLDKLKALTARKTELTSELDSAVMGKDKDAVLSAIEESLVNEAKSIKVTKKEWPYLEFKVGSKLHKVEFDYEDIIDDHGNEGQDQYWLGKDDNGQEWVIDVYASSNGDVEEVHYDTIVKESVVTEGLDKNKPYFDFLVALRDSGATNMFGATPYLQDAFDLSKSEARKILAEWMKSFNEAKTNEAFSRMSNDAIGNELYAASQALTTYYDWLKAGNDAGKGKSIDHIISLLKKCKSSIKRFDNKEETTGTEYEAPAMESVVTEANQLKKGDTVKFKDGRSIYIIGPKGDGYDYKDGREKGHHPKGWFDMMISSGKAIVESTDYIEGRGKPAGLSKKETLKVAQKFADALTKLDGMKYTVSSDYEEDSFDLDIEDQDDVDPRITGEYAGGSYNINADGSVVNMAVSNKKNSSPVYGNMDDDIKTIIKTIKNIKESLIAETKDATFTFEAEETPSWNNLMETINYKLNEDLRRGLKKYIKQNEDELNKLADEDAFDTIYDNIRAEFDITEGTKEDRDMIETFKFMF